MTVSPTANAGAAAARLVGHNKNYMQVLVPNEPGLMGAPQPNALSPPTLAPLVPLVLLVSFAALY